MLKRFWSGLLTILLLTALVPGVANAEVTPQISLALSRTSVAVNESVTLTVTLAGGTDIYGTAVDVVFDPTLLAYEASNVGTLVTGGLTTDQYFSTTVSANPTTATERRSLITLRLGSTIGGASGNGSIAQLTFRAVAQGQVSFVVDDTHVSVQMVNSAGQSVAFTSSTTPVTLTIGGAAAPDITLPADGTWLKTRTFTVSGTAAAGTRLTPKVDTTDLSTITADSAAKFAFPVTVTTDGTHTISVRPEGETTVSDSTSVNVDTVAPSLTVDPVTAAPTVNITGTVSDLNLVGLYIQVNPSPGSNVMDPVTVNTNGTFSHPVMLRQGANVIRLVAKDRAENLTESTLNPELGTLPYLKLVPHNANVAPGATVLVDVRLMNPPAELATVQFELSYPYTLLQANSVDETGNMFTGSVLQPLEYIDVNPDGSPNPGTINWTQSTNTQADPANNLVGVLSFTVRNLTQDALASISFSDLSGVTGGDGVVLNNRSADDLTTAPPVGAAVNIRVGGTIVGKAPLLGRPTTRTGRTDYTGHANTLIEVVDPTSNSVVRTALTAADGTFAVEGVPAGTYTVRFSRRQFLSFAVLSVPVTNGQVTSLNHLTFSVRPGNIKDTTTGKDRVGSEDLTILAQAWLTRAGLTGWNADADLNDDLMINSSDLTLLAQAWLKKGSTLTGSDQVLTYTAAP